MPFIIKTGLVLPPVRKVVTYNLNDYNFLTERLVVQKKQACYAFMDFLMAVRNVHNLVQDKRSIKGFD